MDSNVVSREANEVISACVLLVTLDNASMVKVRPVQVKCVCVHVHVQVHGTIIITCTATKLYYKVV